MADSTARKPQSNGVFLVCAVTFTLVGAACHAPHDDAHDEARADSAVQIVDDGSGPRRVASEPLIRELGDAEGSQVEPLESLSVVHGSEHARIRMLALPGARLSLTIAPASLAPWLASIGATAIERSTAVDDVRAQVPAERVEELLARPELERVAASATARPTAAWSGLELQDALGSVRLRAAGLDGGHGGRTPGGVKIGIIEVEADRGNWPVADHPGWSGRLTTVRDCELPGCPVAHPTPTKDERNTTHATAVAWVAAGSIEGGQDPAFPGLATADQRARSGALGAAKLVFYGTNGSDAVARAIDRSVEDGMDVVNMSLAMGDATTACDPGFDPSGISAHLRAALDAGVVFVASAGNETSGACTVGFPAFRPEVLSIGALDSRDASMPYAALPMWEDDAPGIGSAVGRVDLVTPGCMSGFFTSPAGAGAAYFMGPGSACGTSLASPAGAALVGGLRSALADFGVAIDDGRAMIAQALLLGDGWDPDGSVKRSGMSPRSGAGRARARWPGDGAAPSGWGFRTITIHQGETVTWRVGHAESSTGHVSHWQGAVVQTPSNLESVPAIDFRVDDTCAGSVLASDTTHGVRARFMLDADVGCLLMHAHGARIPPEGATYYFADTHARAGTPAALR